MVYLSDILKTSEHYETAITNIESTLAVITSIKATAYVYEKEKPNIVQANVELPTLSKFLESIRRLKEAYNSLIDLNISGISRYCTNLDNLIKKALRLLETAFSRNIKFITDSPDTINYDYMKQLSRGIVLISTDNEVLAASHLKLYILSRNNYVSQILDPFRLKISEKTSDLKYPQYLKEYFEACITVLSEESNFSKKLFYSTSEEQEVLRQVCSVALIPFLETIQTNLVGRLFGQSSILSTDDFGVILCSLESFFLLKELLSSDDRQQSHILFANFLKPITGVTVSIFSAATKAMAMILKKLKEFVLEGSQLVPEDGHSFGYVQSSVVFIMSMASLKNSFEKWGKLTNHPIDEDYYEDFLFDFLTFFLAKLENIFYLAGQKYTTLNRELPSEVNTALAKSYELLLGINNYSLIIETLQQSSILAELMAKELEELRHLLKIHKSQFVQLFDTSVSTLTTSQAKVNFKDRIKLFGTALDFILLHISPWIIQNDLDRAEVIKGFHARLLLPFRKFCTENTELLGGTTSRKFLHYDPDSLDALVQDLFLM